MNISGDSETWLVNGIRAFGTDGNELAITGPKYISTDYSFLPIDPKYLEFQIEMNGNNHVTLEYQANHPIVVGYLETLLLRPEQHEIIDSSSLSFVLPDDWKSVTVIRSKSEENNFDLGRLDSMYGDNANPAMNFVPMAFAVGEFSDIVEVETSCGRLIYSYPDMYGHTFTSKNSELGKKFFEYMCENIGPLEPFRTFIANNNWQKSWLPEYYQPGLYSYFWQHNRTMDWSTGIPNYEFVGWRYSTFSTGETVMDEPDVTYYHFPHSLSRAWFKNNTYFVLDLNLVDWAARGGFSGYFQETMLYHAFDPIKVYMRFRQTYEYYKNNYLGTSQDVPLMKGGDHFIVYFKSMLWAFYANQLILEESGGQYDLSDAIKWLYQKYGGAGIEYTYDDIQEAINTVANADLSDLFQVYAKTNEQLPLDIYFEDDDNDNVPNGLEYEMNLDLNNADSNLDGISDSEEVRHLFSTEPSIQFGEPVLTDEQGDVLHNRGSMDLLNVFITHDGMNLIYKFEFAQDFRPKSSRIDFWLPSEQECNIKVTLEGRETHWNNWNYSYSGIKLYDECDRVPISQEGAFTLWSGNNVIVQIPTSVVLLHDNVKIERVEIISYQDWEVYDFAELP